MTEQDWYAAGPGRGTCRKCGEDRLIGQVADPRGVQNYCEVCAHSWWIHGPITIGIFQQRFARKP